MTRTYLVAIESDGTDDTEATAQDIQDVLLDNGFDVSSVKAWASPTPGVMSPVTITPPPPLEPPSSF